MYLNLWVFESCGYMFSKFEFCGYLNVGIQNMWVLKIYLYSQFAGLRFMGTQKFWVLKFVGIHTHLLILKFWDTLICGYSKFVGTQNF